MLPWNVTFITFYFSLTFVKGFTGIHTLYKTPDNSSFSSERINNKKFSRKCSTKYFIWFTCIHLFKTQQNQNEYIHHYSSRVCMKFTLNFGKMQTIIVVQFQLVFPQREKTNTLNISNCNVMIWSEHFLFQIYKLFSCCKEKASNGWIWRVGFHTSV